MTSYIEMIARATHEMSLIYCEATGDNSQVNWFEAPEWQRKSAIEGVKNALDGATPQESHEAWMRLKFDEGWIWGPVKNAEMKTHPCLVPYDKLPPHQKAKDALFIATAKAMATALRFSP